MASYRFFVQQFTVHFEGCEFHHVPRINNEMADMLAKIGSTQRLPRAPLQAIHHAIARIGLHHPNGRPQPDPRIRGPGG